MTVLELETDEADWLAHELSALTGESVTAVVIKALAAQLARERYVIPLMTKADWDSGWGE